MVETTEQLSEIAGQSLTDTITYDTERLLSDAKQLYDDEREP